MSNINQQVESLLSIPQPSLSATTVDPIVNQGLSKLYVIAGITRKVLYQYATIGATGNIAFHAMSPFNFIDDNQREAQYKKKTCFVSVNMDSQQNPNDPSQYYNNNFGCFLAVLKGTIEVNGRQQPNPYNAIELHASVIKQALIPTDVDNIDLNIINKPCLNLKNKVALIKQEDFEAKEKAKLFMDAYEEYKQEVLALVEQGHLSYSFILINPKPDSISFDLGLEESMRSGSNAWLNYNTVLNQGLPLSKIPTLNQYKTVVQIIETDDLSLFHSDNINMLGKKDIYTNEAGKSRQALSLVALIKDYNNDTPILVAITDNANISNVPNSRGRVEALEALLDKGISTFTVTGSLSPVVRLIDSNAGRHGNIFFELVVDKYEVYQSSNIRNTLDVDAFNDLSYENVETGIDAEMFGQDVTSNVVLDVATVSVEEGNTSNSKKGSKGNSSLM